MIRCFVLLLLGLACRPPTGPSMYEIVPPAEWRIDAAWVWQNCAKDAVERPKHPYDGLRFIIVDAEVFDLHGDTGLVGYWRGNTIFLAARPGTPLRLILKHELLHALTGKKHAVNWNQTDNIFRACWIKAEALGVN